MAWQKGQSGNPKGGKPGPRKPDARFRRTAPVLTLLRERNDVDSLDLLSAVVSHPDIEMPTRVAAAVALAPYQHSKCTTRYISKRVELPNPRTVEEATDQIAQVGGLARLGYIALDVAETVIGHLKAFIEALVASNIEERLAAVEGALKERSPIVEIDVQSDLPSLPGNRCGDAENAYGCP